MELITREQVEASLISDVTKRNFQQLIETCKNAPITKETIRVNYPVLSQLRDVYFYLKERLEEENKPDKERIKIRTEVFNGYMKQIEQVLSVAEPQMVETNKSILLAERIINSEIDKQLSIRKRHVEFVKEMTHKIVVTTDSKELGRIQSLIGTEKSRTSFYGEYHIHISASCDALLALIDSHKRIIKENAKLKKDQEKYNLKNDIAKVTELEEHIRYNEQVIKENAESLASEAFNQILGIETKGEKVESLAVQPRTHRWSYKILDIEKLYKEIPDLVELVPNKKAINAFVKEKSEAGGLDDIEDNVISGLAIYWKSFFVAIKTDSDAS